MRRFKLTLLIMSGLFFLFLELGIPYLSPYYEVSLLEKFSVLVLFLSILALLLHRFFSPLERIMASIIPYDEDFSSKLVIEAIGKRNPFTQFAVHLNTLIEKAGSHIERSREKDLEREGILDSLNEGVIALSVLSEVTFVNDKACEMLQISRIDLMDKSLKEIREVGGLFKK